jgi:hypothetical protein
MPEAIQNTTLMLLLLLSNLCSPPQPVCQVRFLHFTEKETEAQKGMGHLSSTY